MEGPHPSFNSTSALHPPGMCCSWRFNASHSNSDKGGQRHALGPDTPVL